VRLLFVSSTTGGGSGRSQRELAAALTARGHHVTFVVDDKRPARPVRFVYEQLSDLAVRWSRRPGVRAVRWLASLPGRRTHRRVIDNREHHVTAVPENAFAHAVDRHRPDVVVGNSLVRLSWRRIRQECIQRRIPTVLYVRETATYGHVEGMDDPADALVANATSLANSVRALGYDCDFVPSLTDTTLTRVESQRLVALLVNPIDSHGIDLFWLIAERLPKIRFALQESWPLSTAQAALIGRHLRTLPNVEFRPRVEPGPELYADARVVLLPHRLDNRPRVVAEAQANAIPVIASDYQGLREAVGSGGLLLGPDDIDAWVHAIERVWLDQACYDDLCRQARRHSARSEMRPEVVVEGFEAVLAKARGAHTVESNTDLGGVGTQR
jgi:glycosyltransferase involved in cell wall biosynthesis